MDTLYVWLTSNAVAALVTTGALGLVIGSFLNVVIHRLPVMLERTWLRQCQEMSGAETSAVDAEETYNLITPRSRCPHCNHNITALQNIPVISFLWLKGKCVACGHPISWRYPVVELLTAILSMVVVWHFGMTFAGGAALLFTWMLIVLTIIDFDHQILPDNLTLPLIWAGLLVNLYPNPTFAPLTSAVIGAIAGYLSLWSVFHIFKLITGKEGMGYGDFKLFAAFGAWLGWQNLPLIILLASLVGAIMGGALILVLGRDRQLPIPFGPFLCAAGWIALLWGSDLTRFYLQFVGLN